MKTDVDRCGLMWTEFNGLMWTDRCGLMLDQMGTIGQTYSRLCTAASPDGGITLFHTYLFCGNNVQSCAD